MYSLNDFKFGKWLNSSIWSIDGTLTGITISSQSGSESNGKKGLQPQPIVLNLI